MLVKCYLYNTETLVLIAILAILKSVCVYRQVPSSGILMNYFIQMKKYIYIYFYISGKSATQRWELRARLCQACRAHHLAAASVSKNAYTFPDKQPLGRNTTQPRLRTHSSEGWATLPGTEGPELAMLLHSVLQVFSIMPSNSQVYCFGLDI